MPAPKRSPAARKPIRGIALLDPKERQSLRAQRETHEIINRKVTKTK